MFLRITYFPTSCTEMKYFHTKILPVILYKYNTWYVTVSRLRIYARGNYTTLRKLRAS